MTSISPNPMDPFYSGPTLSISQVLAELPKHPSGTSIEYEDLAKVISHDINFETLLFLAQRIAALIVLPQITGVIVSLGTNALEEVAYFIHLVIATAKPIVFTGAMRPRNSLGYDGGRNLYNALTIVNSPQAANRGVLVTLTDCIVGARDAIKINPSSMDNFSGNHIGALGYVHGDTAYFYRDATDAPLTDDFSPSQITYFPMVPILYGYLGADQMLVEAAIAAKAQGLIVAGMGNGYVPSKMKMALAEASKKGMAVVRCSRAGQGVVHIDFETDEKHGFIVGGLLTPQKARVLLMLVLNITNNRKEIQQFFKKYSMF